MIARSFARLLARSLKTFCSPLDLDPSPLFSARLPPDKNQDDLERASARFKEIQNAYEVLSDKQERSWYDNHRDAILKGGQGGGGSSQYQAGGDGVGGGEPPDSDFDLFPFFSATCFSGYGSGEKGFYAVYEDVFSRLAENELDESSSGSGSGGESGGGGGKGGAAAANAAAARASLRERRFPSFGSADTPWEQVSKFYDCWGELFFAFWVFSRERERGDEERERKEKLTFSFLSFLSNNTLPRSRLRHLQVLCLVRRVQPCLCPEPQGS